jgi:hypothetical protein
MGICHDAVGIAPVFCEQDGTAMAIQKVFGHGVIAEKADKQVVQLAFHLRTPFIGSVEHTVEFAKLLVCGR